VVKELDLAIRERAIHQDLAIAFLEAHGRLRFMAAAGYMRELEVFLHVVACLSNARGQKP
jgi:hypothetical protein